ncbi:MAG: cation diffusion facilitator family transporter [Gaiella sp.]
MTPIRRTALVSVVAAAILIVVKLATGLASGSLGFVAEAAHSGTDLVAALLTFFAVGYAAKPADEAHLYGHGKAEHLTALAEAAFLVLVSVAVAGLAVARLAGWLETEVDPAWWAFLAAFVVIAIDITRTVASLRASRRFRSAALMSNALHFGADLAGTLAVLAGLTAAAAGFPAGDSIAALFVAVLVVVAGARLMRRNVDVLMDRAPAGTVEVARAAIAGLEPPVDVHRVRLREAGGRAFADVEIGVSPGAAVGQGHAAAERVERALEHALPGIDVVVHVEPQADAEAALRERVRAAATSVSHVREIHDVAVIETAAGVEVALHLKLPPSLPLAVAHARAEEVERAIRGAIPEVSGVLTHLEPLTEETPGTVLGSDSTAVEDAVCAATGRRPRSTRVLETPQGLVVLVTLAVDGGATLSAAHDQAGAVAARVREAVPGVVDVIVHTEP